MSTDEEQENWRVAATIDRLISNILAACKVLREQRYISLPLQLERDRENLILWQQSGGLTQVEQETIPEVE